MASWVARSSVSIWIWPDSKPRCSVSSHWMLRASRAAPRRSVNPGSAYRSTPTTSARSPRGGSSSPTGDACAESGSVWDAAVEAAPDGGVAGEDTSGVDSVGGGFGGVAVSPAAASASPVSARIQCSNAPTLVYTPYFPGLAQPWPQLTTPAWNQVSPSRTTSGPPLSPWHESFPPRRSPAHTVRSSIAAPG